MSANLGLSPRTCAQKRPYWTKREAKEAIVAVQTRAGGRALNAFRCRCGAWHIGHRPPRRTTAVVVDAAPAAAVEGSEAVS